MDRRRIALSTAAAVAFALVGVTVSASPALAVGPPYTVNADDSTADVILDGSTTATKSPLSDSTSVRVRVIHPTNMTKPTGGYPLIVYLHGTGENRCADAPVFSRTDIAKQGYVVLSFTQRGEPRFIGATWGTGCTDAQAEATDGLNDEGSAAAGPRDELDISELISWARDNYTWAGGTNPCSSACINENAVGVIGLSQGGTRTRMLGVPRPSTCTTSWDCRIKALVPLAAWNPWSTLVNLSSDGANHPVTSAIPENTLWWNNGWGAMHAAKPMAQYMADISKGKHLPKVNHTGTIAAGALSTLTVSTAPYFSQGDVGQYVNVPGAGSGQGTLSSNITAVNSSGTQATLETAAAWAVTNQSVVWSSPAGKQVVGTMASSSTTLTISGSPGFTSDDVGAEVSVANAGPVLNGAATTLWTTIASVSSATTAVLADAANSSGSGSDVRVRWGARGWYDRRTLVDDDDAVDKMHAWKIPTLVVQGWLDGDAGIYNAAAIEAYNRMPSTAVYTQARTGVTGDVAKYLYLGGCQHYPDHCPATVKANMAATITRFFDRYVNGNSGTFVRTPGSTTCATTGPCVLYSIPTKWVSGTTNAWTVSGAEQTSTVWPPTTGTTTTQYYLHDTNHSMDVNIGGNTQPYESITNSLMLPTVVDQCLGNGYSAAEYKAYDLSFGTDTKVVKFVADLRVATDVPKLQLYADLVLVDSAGNEIPMVNSSPRVWMGSGQVAPTLSNLKPSQLSQAGTKLQFVFQPGGVAWTVASGQKLRLKVSTNYRSSFAQMPMYTPNVQLYHDGGSNASSFTITKVS